MTLNPGSKDAHDKGCLCPVIDNHYGEGITIDGKQEFWHNGDCPLHGFKKEG